MLLWVVVISMLHLCFISEVLEVFLWLSIRMGCGCWLRFSYCYCVMLEVNCLLIGDVRGELVNGDCHWVVVRVCSIDCSYLG